jgi:AhpD family alkylhydroperoxidase
MHQHRGFIDLDENTAPSAARPILAGTRAKFGYVPSALARMVASPLLARAFSQALATFEQTSLTPAERETIVLTLARKVECDVCVAIHEGIAAKLEDQGDPRKLDVLRRFTEAVLESRGDVDPAAWNDFLSAGYDRVQALEVVLGVGAYTMSTFANRMTAAPVD